MRQSGSGGRVPRRRQRVLGGAARPEARDAVTQIGRSPGAVCRRLQAVAREGAGDLMEACGRRAGHAIRSRDHSVGRARRKLARPRLSLPPAVFRRATRRRKPPERPFAPLSDCVLLGPGCGGCGVRGALGARAGALPPRRVAAAHHGCHAPSRPAPPRAAPRRATYQRQHVTSLQPGGQSA